jgi:hypothetical protein
MSHDDFGGGDGGGDFGDSAGGDGGGEWTFEAPDDGEGGNGSKAYQAHKNALILIIDVRDAMFTPRTIQVNNKKDEQPQDVVTTDFSVAMDFTRLYLRQQIVSGSKDMVMILAMGSGKGQNSSGYNDIYEFSGFNQSDTQCMKDLYLLSRPDETSIRYARSLFDVKSNDPNIDSLTCLEHAFWYCSTKFQEKKLKPSDTQRVFILTNDSDPSRGKGEEVCKKTFQRVRDLGEAGRVVTLWPLRPDSEFPLHGFWKRLLIEHVKSRRAAISRNLSYESQTTTTTTTNSSNNIISSMSPELLLDQSSSLEDDVENRVCYDASSGQLDALFDGIKKKAFVKRQLYHCPMYLGPGVEIATSWYMTTKIATTPNPVVIHVSTGMILKSETRWICEGTVDYITPDQIITAAQYGALGVPFSKAEQSIVQRFNVSPVSVMPANSLSNSSSSSSQQQLNSASTWLSGIATVSTSSSSSSSSSTIINVGDQLMKSQDPSKFGLAGFLVLGFKPQSEFPVSLSLGQSYFMRPDETKIIGSTKVFNALLAETAEAGLAILGICQTTTRGVPRLVAAFPQEEIADTHGEIVQPGGFIVTRLPYMDDLRKPRLDEPLLVRAEENSPVVEAAKDVVRALSSRYEPTNFDNPAIQKFYTNLEALAKIYSTDQTATEWDPSSDTLLPNDDEFTFNEALVGPLMKFNEAYGGLDTVLEEKKKKPAVKRSAAAITTTTTTSSNNTRRDKDDDDGDDGDEDDEDGGNSKAKKIKSVTLSEDEIKELVATNKLKSLTVDGLKNFCRDVGLPLSGKKDDLVLRIEKYIAAAATSTSSSSSNAGGGGKKVQKRG